MDNAVGFTEKGSVVLHLTVDTAITPHQVSIGVANPGAQLADEAMTQWFDPMFSDRQTDSGEMHLGLGLYIVKMIAESHGGRVFAKSQRTADAQQWIHVGMQLPMS